jgi:hypothetical protein
MYCKARSTGGSSSLLFVGIFISSIGVAPNSNCISNLLRMGRSPWLFSANLDEVFAFLCEFNLFLSLFQLAFSP